MPLFAAALVIAALLAPFAYSAPSSDAGAQARCLAKQLRKHGGPEGGRASAMKGHFSCFPDRPERFVALFAGDGADAGPLAADHAAHLELFFAARPAVGERAWSAKAVGVLAGASWTPGAVDLYGDLLVLQLKERPAGPLDAAAKLDAAALAAFWQTLFGSGQGFRPEGEFCAGREAQRACVALAELR